MVRTNKKEAGTEIQSWKMALTPVVEAKNTITSEREADIQGFKMRRDY
jgi:hypothetical protein